MIERYAEHHRAAAELPSALLWPRMDGGDVAMETGLAAELRRGIARRGGLPSSNSVHWWTLWFAEDLVVLLW